MSDDGQRTHGPAIPTADLEAALQSLADDLGHTPTKADMNEHGAYSARTYHDRFGSWTAAIEAANLGPRPDSTGRLSTTVLEAELWRLSNELGRQPTTNDMDEHGAFSATTYLDRYASWTAAVRAAGVIVERVDGRITDEALEAELRRLADDLDSPPTSSEMGADGRFSAVTYIERYGSWAEALAAIDLEEPSTRLTDEALCAELHRVAEELGRRPSTNDMNEYGAHSAATYQDRFGSWTAALSTCLD